MPHRTASPFAILALAGLAALLVGCRGGPEPAPTATAPPAAAAPSPKPAPSVKKAPTEIVIDVPEQKDGRPQVGSIVIGGPKPAENVTFVYAKPDRDDPNKPRKPFPVPAPSGNTSAMPDAEVAYVRFVRTVEEERQTKAAERQERLEAKTAADPAALAELRAAVLEAKGRLARLKARPAPARCRPLRDAYEAALLLDGAHAQQDADLLAQAVSAAKAGDSASAKPFLDQLQDPTRKQNRSDERYLAFGRTDTALVEILRDYPTSPADFASIRFGDNPF